MLWSSCSGSHPQHIIKKHMTRPHSPGGGPATLRIGYDRQKKMAGQCYWYIRVRGNRFYVYLPHGKPRDKDFEWWVGINKACNYCYH